MRDGPRRFPRGSTCPGVLGCQLTPPPPSPTGLSPALAGLPRPFGWIPWSLCAGPTTPCRLATTWFGLFPFRSPLLGESRFLSSPAGTEMFQFPTFAPYGLWIQPQVTGVSTRRVSPFGHRRIIACSRLPDAFRSVPRPSSPPDAKASTVSPF